MKYATNNDSSRAIRWISRTLALLTVALAFSPAASAEVPAKKMSHKHTPAAVAGGVSSMDVFAEGGRLHLLIVRRQGEAEPPLLQYLRSDDAGTNWTDSRTIAGDDLPPPIGAHRGMDVQVSAAGDHVVAAWTIYSAESRFGRGKIATALSADGGKTWRAGPNPADDGSEGDHAFLDLSADERGTFHAVWLDSRSGKKGLIYSSSADGGATWSRNAVLDAESCECCWNAIVTTGKKVQVLFRNKNPRDMAMIGSDDGGKTWGATTAVGDFKWNFDGCPHVGGGLAVADGTKGSRIFATAWTGKPDVVGSYLLASSDGGRSWEQPVQIGDARSVRTDVAAGGGKVAVVWDSVVDGKGAAFAATSSDNGKTWSAPVRLTATNVSATYPRVVHTRDGFRVFWTEGGDGEPDVWRTQKL